MRLAFYSFFLHRGEEESFKVDYICKTICLSINRNHLSFLIGNGVKKTFVNKKKTIKVIIKTCFVIYEKFIHLSNRVIND